MYRQENAKAAYDITPLKRLFMQE